MPKNHESPKRIPRTASVRLYGSDASKRTQDFSAHKFLITPIGNAVDLDFQARGRQGCLDRGPGGFRVAEVFCVDFVHGLEVANIGKKH